MKRKRLMLTLFVVLVAAAIVVYMLPEQALTDASVSGLQLRSQRWSGTITVAGDVLVVPWKTLTLEPGTTVRFEKKPDIEGTPWTQHADEYIKTHNDPTGRSGYKKTHFNIVAKFSAVGTADERITFTSSSDKPDYADWDELIALTGSVFDRVEVAYAHNGINIEGKNVVLRNALIHDSLWSCVDVFSWGATIENSEIFHCWHQAVGFKTDAGTNRVNTLQNNVIRDANLGINCEGTAPPWVTQNQFSGAPIAESCRELLGPKAASDNTISNRRPDTGGGTYNGQLIYPASL